MAKNDQPIVTFTFKLMETTFSAHVLVNVTSSLARTKDKQTKRCSQMLPKLNIQNCDLVVYVLEETFRPEILVGGTENKRERGLFPMDFAGSGLYLEFVDDGFSES